MSEQAQAAQSAATESANSSETIENTQENILDGANSSASDQNIADLKDQAANGTAKEKAEAKKMLKSLKIKFNGKELEETLPFEIPDDDEAKEFMTRHLQMSKLGQTKAQEYSQLEREVASFVEQLRKDPRKVLSDPTIGIDIKKLAAQVIEEEIENSKKTPEQVEREKLEAELKAMKEEREKEKEEARKRDFERLQQQEYERYDMLMTQALEKHTDLPKSPYVIKKMADAMLIALEKGHDVTPEDIIPFVRSEIQEDLKEMFKVLPEDVIEQLVGKEKISGIRKKKVAAAKAANTAPLAKVQDVGASSEKKEEKPKEKMSIKDFLKV